MHSDPHHCHALAKPLHRLWRGVDAHVWQRAFRAVLSILAGTLVSCAPAATPTAMSVNWRPVKTAIQAALEGTMTAEVIRQTPTTTQTPSPRAMLTASATRIPTLAARPSPSPSTVPTPSLTPVRQATPTRQFPPTPGVVDCEPAFTFIRDVSIPDDTVLQPGEGFTKTWAVTNSGTCDWGEGYLITHSDGASLGAPEWSPLPATVAGERTEISLTMRAPSEAGAFRSDWRLCAGLDNCFGPTLYLQIVVTEPTPAATPPAPPP